MQATLFQLDNYGPWTTTPEPRPEMCLQTLQSRLYADIAEAVGDHGGYAFYARGDNVVAVTPGMDRQAHEGLLDQLDDRYPVSVSAGIGSGETPQAALAAATGHLQQAGSAQDPDRQRVLVGETGGIEPLDVAHFDVVDATTHYTDTTDAYTAYQSITRGIGAIADPLYDRGALTFFVGGDNAIAVCPLLEKAAYKAALGEAERTGVDLRVGVGTAETPTGAGIRAKHALEAGRETGERITLESPTRAEQEGGNELPECDGPTGY
jgi:GTP cyclohydrolase IIa